jgi:RNA polymerase sigma factor (sigma-70 family)
MDKPRSKKVLRTAWTKIVEAQQAGPDDTVRRHCLDYLAETYRDAVKMLVRTWGVRDENQADDLVQEYFTRFLEKDWLNQLDRDRGRFRAFLRVSVRHFLLNEKDKQRRRPSHVPIATEHGDDDLRGAPEPASKEAGPEEAFNRAWARALMAKAVANFELLCQERELSHYWSVFDRHVLRPDEFNQPSYSETAKALGMTEEDVTRYLHRARNKFSNVVREMIRETVASEDEVDHELADLQRYFV